MIHREDRGPVAVLQMDEGPGNYVNIALVDALERALDDVLQSTAAAVVLTGNRSTFIDGGDLVAIVEGGPSYIRVFVPKFAALLKRVFTLPLPVVAAVNGSAMTSGYTLAAACDLRVMTSGGKARIAVQALNFGVPLEPVPLEMVRFVVPHHRVQHLMHTGRELSPTEALAEGFVDELASPERVLTRALEIATHLSTVPHASFALTKRQLRQAALDQIERYEAAWTSEVIGIWTDPRTLAVWGAIVEQLKRQSAKK